MERFLTEDVGLEVTEKDVISTIRHRVTVKNKEVDDDAFYVADLGELVHKYKLWKDNLPRIEPFYATKCNDDPAILAVLAHLGTGFDCSNKIEIESVLDLNVSPDRIVYAHPCKQNSHLRYAANHNVNMMTFDSVAELHKVKAICPKAKLILRIHTDDSEAMYKMSNKFGCFLNNVPDLISEAKELALDVIGVSFHVGSNSYNIDAFEKPLSDARAVFDIAKQFGFSFTLLDVGGGFPGERHCEPLFEKTAAHLRLSLAEYFPGDNGLRIIAEPGRFFATSVYTLTTNVIAKKVVNKESEAVDNNSTSHLRPSYMYYVNDGVYGSFGVLLHNEPPTEPHLVSMPANSECYTSSVWGPTCSGTDCLITDFLMPEVEIGDWVYFKEMGAYSTTIASNFNGMTSPPRHYIIQDSVWEWLIALKKDVPVIADSPYF